MTSVLLVVAVGLVVLVAIAIHRSRDDDASLPREVEDDADWLHDFEHQDRLP